MRTGDFLEEEGATESRVGLLFDGGWAHHGFRRSGRSARRWGQDEAEAEVAEQGHRATPDQQVEEHAERDLDQADDRDAGGAPAA